MALWAQLYGSFGPGGKLASKISDACDAGILSNALCAASSFGLVWGFDENYHVLGRDWLCVTNWNVGSVSILCRLHARPRSWYSVCYMPTVF